MNLGAALTSVGRGTEAAAVLRAGASLDGSGLKDKRAHEAARVQALLQLGALYADQGRLQRALSAYREALHALPDHYPPQVSSPHFPPRVARSGPATGYEATTIRFDASLSLSHSLTLPSRIDSSKITDSPRAQSHSPRNYAASNYPSGRNTEHGNSRYVECNRVNRGSTRFSLSPLRNRDYPFQEIILAVREIELREGVEAWLFVKITKCTICI